MTPKERFVYGAFAIAVLLNSVVTFTWLVHLSREVGR